MSGPAPYEHVNPSGRSASLILCDHATNIVPPELGGGSLGLPGEDMARHIAYDIGARGVAVEMARLMDAPALMTRFSRLVIDPNRGEDDPTLLMKLYDGTIIPANRHAGAAETEARLDAWHRPYHRAINAEIDRMLADGLTPALISVHSYTRALRGRPPRPWHVGILWRYDGRLALPLIDRLRSEGDLCVGENQPYDGQLEGDTLSRHGTRRGLRHVLIEVRQDLIGTESEQRAWAARLAPVVRNVVDETSMEELADG